jgi:hypothetical protein
MEQRGRPLRGAARIAREMDLPPYREVAERL